jgi:hypothetical protein
MLWLFCATLILGSIGTALLFLGKRLLGTPSVADCSWAWIDTPPAQRYAPLLRLLSNSDYEVLGSLPGLDPGVSKRLRRERRRLFGDYVRILECDFNGIQRALSILAIQSQHDESELLLFLLKQRWSFARRLCAVRAGYYLDVLGLGSVDVQPLIAVTQSLCGKVHDLCHATMGTSCTIEWATTAAV